MPLPAAMLLQPDSNVKPGWAVFDPVWYLKEHGAALPRDIAITPAALLRYYLEQGGPAGHSPSPLFDEAYYLATHPDVAALVKAGRHPCGFDHFCQLGHRTLSGHWLFDDGFYGGMFEDMSLENLDGNGFYGRYDHYLRSGQHEHRLAHPLFDSRFYTATAIAAGDAARVIQQLGSYSHFLYRLQSALPELPPSVYFDPVSYQGSDGPKSGSAIGHYLKDSAATGQDPVPEFCEEFYIQGNPDVRAALDAGICRSGYQHFLQTGVFEFRQPSSGVDLAYYRDFNAAVRTDLNTGAVRDAFAHLRAIGVPGRLPYAPPLPDAGISEAAAKEVFIRKARANLAIFGRRKLDFSTDGICKLAVIVVMFDKFELTMLSLSSLRSNFGGGMQLILVDNGSSDQTAEIEQYVEGAVIIRLNRNIGYLRACNLALRQVSAELVLFLNNDIELGYGAIDSAIARIGSASDIGALGGKVIRSHGLLQEAGCIIWRDGSTSGYMRGASPLVPEANFLREVDFCSAVFLLCRGEIVKKLGGFDAQFSPAYYEEADLCVRIAAAGYRILYDPAVVIHHLEYGSADDAAAKALMQHGQRRFANKHVAFLQTRPVNDPRGRTAARTPRRRGKNILFIEDTIPLRRLGSGYVRANDIVHAIAAAGHAVSVFPVNGVAPDVSRMVFDLPEGAEILHDRDIDGLGEFLESRPGHYDLIWISRTHNLARVLPLCLGAGIDPAKTPFVLDTEAIATVRDAARCALSMLQDFDFAQSLRDEMELARLCRHCLAVNDMEAGLLARIGLRSVSVPGTMCRPDPTPAGFSERSGILFVGSIHRQDSPNLDALTWYAQEVLPALMHEMAVPPVLNFAGYVAPGIDLGGLSTHPHIRIHGSTVSLRQHYEQNRLFIAPSRFAAGTPYKLYEAAASGLPCVATGLLAGQLNWQASVELLTASVNDSKRFAAEIVRLYTSPELWLRLRENALARIANENSEAAFAEAVRRVLHTVLLQTASEKVADPPPARGLSLIEA